MRWNIRVWVFFDDTNLYVAARCWDSHPEREIVAELRCDSNNISSNENFTVALDTFYDRRNGFYFQTTPLGAIRDQTITDEGNANESWNTIWSVKSRQFDRGWTTELAGTLVGLETPGASRNLEVKPYAVASVTTDNTTPVPSTNRFGKSAGFDFKYGLTRSLVADATYNTDFAQVEEDLQQVNLTRFSLFFPEKREFFLEGQGINAFGGALAVSSTGGGVPRQFPSVSLTWVSLPYGDFSTRLLGTRGEVFFNLGGW